MKPISILNDVLGPVMRGPSSSHTAGAYHLATLARSLLGDQPVKAEILFDPDGSYAQTYREQGADRAFALGLLGCQLTDERFFQAFELAEKEGLALRFATEKLAEANHPNTVRMQLKASDGKEMAVVANALGLRTAVPGMLGPQGAQIHDVFDLYDLDTLWQDRQGVVDYVLGAQPTGGVFAIGYTDQPFQQYTLDWFPPKMGPGPYYLFYRPYHLCHVEALEWVARAYLYKEALLKPDYGFKTNVIAYAKKDLQAGEVLDGLGGFACYGLIENSRDAVVPGLPVCLADNRSLKVGIKKDQRINLSDVDSQSHDSSAF